jgi:hypothetical protein
MQFNTRVEMRVHKRYKTQAASENRIWNPSGQCIDESVLWGLLIVNYLLAVRIAAYELTLRLALAVYAILDNTLRQAESTLRTTELK